MKYSTYLKEVRSIVITETMLYDNHAFICNRTLEAVAIAEEQARQGE